MNEEASSSPAPRAPGRRGLVAGVAATALLAGAGLAWWRLRPSDLAPGAGEALWSMDFQTPQGGTLEMASLRGRPLLLNFWATWCPPCVEEMPLLDAFFRQHAPNGWQVLGLAIDQPSAVRTFLARLPVSFPIGLAGLEGTGLSKSLGNLAGGLPFTVVFGADGAVRQRRMGRVSEADLKQWATLR
jgi:thiol-disulfide isomerase/thioredoxin